MQICQGDTQPSGVSVGNVSNESCDDESGGIKGVTSLAMALVTLDVAAGGMLSYCINLEDLGMIRNHFMACNPWHGILGMEITAYYTDST